jgi:hypothetical protein
MTLKLKIPEGRAPYEVRLSEIKDLASSRYFVYTADGKSVEYTKASETDALDTIVEIDEGVELENVELLSMNSVKLACLSGTIQRAIKHSTELFGGVAAWEKLQEWQRMKGREK